MKINNSLKVIHITSVHKWNDQRIFKKEILTLSKKYKISLLINSRLKTFIISNVKVISSKIVINNRFFRALISNLYFFWILIFSRNDVYHIHDPELMILAIFLKIFNKIVIFDSHEFYRLQLIEKKYLSSFLKFLIFPTYILIEKIAFWSVNAIIVPCQILGKLPSYFPSKKTFILQNYPILLPTNKNKQTSTKIWDLCYLGSISFSRGLKEIIFLSKYFSIVLAGDFTSKSEKAYFQNNKINVTYLGYINSKKIEKVIQQSYFGLSIFHNLGQYLLVDTFPTKVLEYMKLGVPPVFSENIYLTNLNDKNKFGINFNGLYINDLIKKIQFYKENKKEYDVLSQNSMKLVKKTYNWNKYENTLFEIYDFVLGNKHENS